MSKTILLDKVNYPSDLKKLKTEEKLALISVQWREQEKRGLKQ